MLPARWWHRYEQLGRPVPIDYADEAGVSPVVRHHAGAAGRPGQINLLGLRPLVPRRSSGDCSSTPSAPGRTGGTSGGSVRW